jgi:hypothetical protein
MTILLSEPDDLSPIEITAIVALANACNWSIHAHVPEESIRGIPSNLRGDVRKALDRLRRKGYCQKHPTGGSMTWQLTLGGLEKARQEVSRH